MKKRKLRAGEPKLPELICSVCDNKRHPNRGGLWRSCGQCGNKYHDDCEGFKKFTCEKCTGRHRPHPVPEFQQKLPNHTLDTAHGYLLPDGRLLPCSYYTHITLHQQIRDAYDLRDWETHDLGIIKLQFEDFWLWEGATVTQKQFDTIVEYMTNRNRRWVYEKEKVTLDQLEVGEHRVKID